MYENGQLVIVMPKDEKLKARNIEIIYTGISSVINIRLRQLTDAGFFFCLSLINMI